MKKFILMLGSILAIFVGVIVLYAFLRPPIDEKQANNLAQSSFRSAAKHLKMMPSEFELVSIPTSDLFSNYPVVFVKYTFVTYLWQHKTKSDCKIEVYVDLVYANPRPIFENCDQPKTLLEQQQTYCPNRPHSRNQL